jgi:hypothetical protein
MKAGDRAQAMVDKHWVNVTIAPALPEHDDSVVTVTLECGDDITLPADLVRPPRRVSPAPSQPSQPSPPASPVLAPLTPASTPPPPPPATPKAARLPGDPFRTVFSFCVGLPARSKQKQSASSALVAILPDAQPMAGDVLLLLGRWMRAVATKFIALSDLPNSVTPPMGRYPLHCRCSIFFIDGMAFVPHNPTDAVSDQQFDVLLEIFADLLREVAGAHGSNHVIVNGIYGLKAATLAMFLEARNSALPEQVLATALAGAALLFNELPGELKVVAVIPEVPEMGPLMELVRAVRSIRHAVMPAAHLFSSRCPCVSGPSVTNASGRARRL